MNESRKVLFQIPSVDWRHWPGSLRINQLICSPIICLLDCVWPLPLRLKLALRLVCDDDGAAKHEDQLTFSEYSSLDELVVGSHHVLAIQLQVLQSMESLLLEGIQLLVS